MSYNPTNKYLTGKVSVANGNTVPIPLLRVKRYWGDGVKVNILGGRRIPVGGSYQLDYELNPSDDIDIDTIQWWSSNNAIATVDSSGVVYGVGSGDYTIFVKINNKYTGSGNFNVAPKSGGLDMSKPYLINTSTTTNLFAYKDGQITGLSVGGKNLSSVCNFYITNYDAMVASGKRIILKFEGLIYTSSLKINGVRFDIRTQELDATSYFRENQNSMQLSDSTNPSLGEKVTIVIPQYLG